MVSLHNLWLSLHISPFSNNRKLFHIRYLPGTILGPLAAADRGPLPYLTWLGVALQETTAISSNSWPWTSRVLEEAAVSDWRRPVRLCTKRRAEVDIGPWPPLAPYPPDTTPSLPTPHQTTANSSTKQLA